MEFKKVVLSRKGFDSSAGHGYSPFDPETGKYIVLPIPDEEIAGNFGNGTKFEDIKLQPNYLNGINVSNLRDLISHELLHYGSEAKNESRKKYAHFDPWLGHCPWLTPGSDHHVGAFGPSGPAQTHLQNQGVDVGSLFLFFSRFKPIRGRPDNLGIRVNPLKGVYFLYGWLKVGGKATSFDRVRKDKLLSRHPHATKDLDENYPIYIAKPYLFDGSGIAGCGYFPKLTKSLLLTSEKYFETPSTWELPGFFFYSRPSHLKSREWQKSADGETCTVSSGGRGQEFVFEESEYFWRWFKNLLQENLAS
ncbi:MAG: hypothetical protein Q7R34_06060 [Dehalococcoidia bacterium]|nr:hypothetical protein [Dehalococcoidia bacterium]